MIIEPQDALAVIREVVGDADLEAMCDDAQSAELRAYRGVAEEAELGDRLQRRMEDEERGRRWLRFAVHCAWNAVADLGEPSRLVDLLDELEHFARMRPVLMPPTWRDVTAAVRSLPAEERVAALWRACEWSGAFAEADEREADEWDDLHTELRMLEAGLDLGGPWKEVVAVDTTPIAKHRPYDIGDDVTLPCDHTCSPGCRGWSTGLIPGPRPDHVRWVGGELLADRLGAGCSAEVLTLGRGVGTETTWELHDDAGDVLADGDSDHASAKDAAQLVADETGEPVMLVWLPTGESVTFRPKEGA